MTPSHNTRREPELPDDDWPCVVERAIDLYANKGYGYARTARHLGVSIDTVRRIVKRAGITPHPGSTRIDERDRLLARMRVDEATGCWVWVGTKNPDGYGVAVVGYGNRRRVIGAHRAAWMVFRGPIPEGLSIDHLCQNRACINPDHLEPVTIEENIARAQRGTAAHYRRRTCCEKCQGPLVPDRRGRTCRPCRRAHQTEWQRRRRAEKRAAS